VVSFIERNGVISIRSHTLIVCGIAGDVKYNINGKTKEHKPLVCSKMFMLIGFLQTKKVVLQLTGNTICYDTVERG